MYKAVKTTIYLLYKYYSTGGTKSIAYETALMVTSFFLMIHVLQVKVLLWGGGITFGSTRFERLLSVSVVFIPAYFLLSSLYRKDKILMMEGDNSINHRKGYLFIILYCVFTFSLLTFLVFISKPIM